jgi:thioredoxin-related protein
MTRRQALVFALAICGALFLIAAYKLGPRTYNKYRSSQLQGRQVYDPSVDARAAYEQSLQRAQREKKQLLVVLGGNWCQWCLALDDLMREDVKLRDYLAQHFVVLKLDSASAKALDDAWGKPSHNGVPVLVFVDRTGTVKHVQETESLELWHGRVLGHDPHRVLAVLERWS